MFEAAVRRWWIDDLALVDCTCGPCSGTRTRRELSETDGEFVVVLITLAGRETVAQGDAEAGLKAGDAVVWDSTKPARFAVSEPLSKARCSCSCPEAQGDVLPQVAECSVASAGIDVESATVNSSGLNSNDVVLCTLGHVREHQANREHQT